MPCGPAQRPGVAGPSRKVTDGRDDGGDDLGLPFCVAPRNAHQHSKPNQTAVTELAGERVVLHPRPSHPVGVALHGTSPLLLQRH